MVFTDLDDNVLGEISQSVTDFIKTYVAKMGQISVSFYAVTNVRVPRVIDDFQRKLPEYDTVPENALKRSSLSHRVRYVEVCT
jgi:hypothetical protein